MAKKVLLYKIRTVAFLLSICDSIIISSAKDREKNFVYDGET